MSNNTTPTQEDGGEYENFTQYGIMPLPNSPLDDGLFQKT